LRDQKVEKSKMVKIDVSYDGNLRCSATHSQSGTLLHTDAPKDNHGWGESFSPTDLLATALGTCMLTVMGIAARRLEIDLSGVSATVLKEMTASPPRRVASLTVSVRGPAQMSDENRRALEDAALTCPVHKSLHPDVKLLIQFAWEE
jgi:putative redox protein